MPIAEHDRHVLALAVHVEADSIITFNLRDFPANACEPYGVEAIDPDTFVAAIADTDPARVRVALGDIVRRRTRPPMIVNEILGRLVTNLPTFVSRGTGGLARSALIPRCVNTMWTPPAPTENGAITAAEPLPIETMRGTRIGIS
jgi:hypothetical protein